MIIYKLSIYDHDTYSYSGLDIKEEVYFIHPALAKRYAKDNGVSIVSTPSKADEATLDEVDVIEDGAI